MIKRALIVKEPWAVAIVTGYKKKEYRNRACRIRERVGIISAGHGTIIGEVDIVDCEPSFALSHCGYSGRSGFAWILKNPERYPVPRKYKHPPGAQVWVRIHGD